MNKLLIVAIVVVLVLGIGLIVIEKNKNKLRSTSYKDATYLIDNKLVTLDDGLSVTEAAPGSAEKITTNYFGNHADGDFNRDGTTDTAFLLRQTTGGTGVYYYVVAALKTEEGYFETNTIYLGDRIRPQSTEFLNGKIVVNFAEHLPEQAMAETPAKNVSRYFKIEGTKLVEVGK